MRFPDDRVVSRPVAATMLHKVPRVNPLFWLVEVCCTAVGETGADFLNRTLGLGLPGTTTIAAVLLVVGLVAQFAVGRAVPAIYWANIVVISVVGTLLADNLIEAWHVPLWASTTIFAAGLGIAFLVWYRSERTLAIDTIVTRRREAFYWVAIALAFALGSAAGDWFAEGVGLGYLASSTVLAGAIAVVAVARFGFDANEVGCFWVACILTRPFGSSLGDLFTQAPQDGGLGAGTAVVSDAFLLLVIGGTVAFTVRERLATRDGNRGPGLAGA